jgi:Arc/MetJ-type ribon-helix-helix transcriptional regulator
MDIRLKPELEAMIREDLNRGPYTSAEDLVEQAISQLHEREDWLAQHRDEISRKIDEGWRSAEEGRLLSPDEAKAEMASRKKAWLDARKDRNEVISPE